MTAKEFFKVLLKVGGCYQIISFIFAICAICMGMYGVHLKNEAMATNSNLWVPIMLILFTDIFFGCSGFMMLFATILSLPNSKEDLNKALILIFSATMSLFLISFSISRIIIDLALLSELP